MKYKFCSLDELKREKMVTRWVEEFRDEISAFYFEDKIWVYSAICPHFGGNFECNSKSGILRCAWHGWKFDLKTGKSLTNFKDYQPDSLIRRILESGNEPLGCFPFKGKLMAYSHQVNGDDVEIMNHENH